MKKTVKEIAQFINGKVIGNPDIVIQGITNIAQPKKDFITFIDHKRYLSNVEKTDISCIIVPENITSSSKTIIQVKNPKLSFALLLNLFFPPRTFSGTISPKASIDSTAKIGEGTTVEDFAVIGKNVKIGKNATIRSYAYIDEDVALGNNTIIHPRVMIYDHAQIGNNVIIHSGTVIGSDGFGFIKDENGKQIKIPQLGNVIIEDDVEIGSNVSIDRATFGATIIKNGVKIDNLVQIAHNVYIGENTVVSGHAGIAGSASIGKNCVLAARVAVGDHCVIEDNVILAGLAALPSKKRVPCGQILAGIPARPLDVFKKQQGILTNLPRILEELKKVRKNIQAKK